MDEQLKSLRPDFDDLEERGQAARKEKKSMDTSQAIILAAIIIVSGFWGGKIYYDHLQAQKVDQAFRQIALGFKEMTEQTKKSNAIAAQQRQQRQHEMQQAQQRREQEKKAALANTALEKRRASDKCRFWWNQHETAPTEKSAINKAFHCEI